MKDQGDAELCFVPEGYPTNRFRSIAVNGVASSVNLMRAFQIPEGTIKDCLLRVPRRRLARMPDLLRLEESFPERLHT